MYNPSNELYHAWEEQDLERGDASTIATTIVRRGENEETFNPRAQRAMSEYRDVITAAMWADYTASCE